MANYTEWMTEQRDLLQVKVDTLTRQIDRMMVEKTDLATLAMKLASDKSNLQAELAKLLPKE